MLRLRPPAWSGVRSLVQDGRSDVTSGAQGAQSDVSSGAQVQLPAPAPALALQVQVQLPAQLSNSTGWAKALIEPAAPPPRETKRRTSPLARLRCPVRNMIGSLEPSSLRRSCSSGSLSSGIRTSRGMQLGTLSLGKARGQSGAIGRVEMWRGGVR